MPIFAFSVFLSAFLLFQIEPLISKFILPWFGGTPAVWSTAMLFFQVLLTGGYAYAYWLIGRVTRQRQSLIHTALTLLAVVVVASLAFSWPSPITPPASFKPIDVQAPVWDIFRLLVVSIGLPFFLLASNSPLMQAWFSRRYPQKSYTRLYALSNVGSLLGLLMYPTLIEPNFTIKEQGWVWSVGFLVFSGLLIWLAFQNSRSNLTAQSAPAPAISTPRPGTALRLLWILLSATASLFLLSITNQISQEIAVIPFLWVLPLSLYLLSFVLTFSGQRGYNRKVYLAMFAVAVVLIIVMIPITGSGNGNIYLQIGSYCLLMFSACMLCHGELYLLRPAADHLTSFYLMVSIGGAIGGIFVSLIAPLIFTGYWEFMVALALAMALWLTVLRYGQRLNHAALARFMIIIFFLVTIPLSLLRNFSDTQLLSRNFFGVIRVKTIITEPSQEPAYGLINGITIHGLQFINPELRDTPTSYYARNTGIGLLLSNYPRAGHGLRVGVLGLGAGTLATYGRSGDSYRFYEINPTVIDLAEGQGGYFSFLKDSQADTFTVPGDARLSLEQELSAGQRQNFDVLVLDTFTSDSIPVHLVTQEAFELYTQHLTPDGVIAAHISNLYLDLKPVFWQLAKNNGFHIVSVANPANATGGSTSEWLIMSRDPAQLEFPATGAVVTNLDDYSTSLKLWTDDYSNLFQILVMLKEK